MADWSKSKFLQQQQNPAAPEGLQQEAARQGSKWSQASQGLQRWAPQDSYVASAQSWYGGQNVQGVNNGFDNGFMTAAFDYIGSKERDAGTSKNPNTLWNMWDVSDPNNSKATGVATWADPTGANRWKVGDVFENGRNLNANIYEQFDEPTADLMIADFLFTGEEKARIFRDSDREGKLRREVQARTDEQTETAKHAPEAYRFSQDVERTQAQMQESWWGGLGTVAAGMGGGAATGATIGTFVGGPVGTAIGAVAGTVVGGIGAWLNRDQMSEVAARAVEVSDRAYERFGLLQGTAVAAKEFGGLAMKSLSPLSNTYQGIYDASAGDLGDGRSEFYEVDENGQRKASGLAIAADIGLSIADGLLQFGSAPARLAYMGSMGMTTAGGVGALTTGAGFNSRIGGFDQYENAGEWLAALGTVAIDAAQMGQAQGLFNAAQAARSRITGAAVPLAKGRTERWAGMKFTLDEQGRAIDSGMTAELLAPSEMLRYIPARMKARTLARRADGRAVDHNDLYIAARQMTNSGSKWRDALFNAYLEGAEEFVQAGLEPASFSDTPNAGEMFEAALYGAAGGLGMGLSSFAKRGQLDRPPSTAKQREAMARLNYMTRTGETPSDEEWAATYGAMSKRERELLAKATPDEMAEYAGHLQFHEQMQYIDRSRASVFGAAVAQDFGTNNFDRALKKINPAVDQQLVLLGRTGFQHVNTDGTVESTDAANVGMVSAFEAVNSLRKNLLAQEAQLKSASRAVEQATDADERARAQAQVDDLTAQIPVTKEIFSRVKQVYDSELLTSTDEAGFRQAISRMNNILSNAATGQWKDNATGQLVGPEVQELYRRAAELRLSRQPWIDLGSFTVLVPQVSFGMTKDNTHSAIGVHQSILKPIQGDHDGDRFASINMTYLSGERLRDLRLGANMVQTVYDDALGRDVQSIAMDDPDGEETTIREFSQYMWATSSREADEIRATLSRIKTTLEDRYTNPPAGLPGLDAKVVSDLLNEFEADVLAGNKKARSKLINGLYSSHPVEFIAQGSRGTPEAMWLQDYISNEWATTQKAIAALAMTTTTAQPTFSARKPEDRAFQRDVARRNGVNASTTIGILGSGDGTRDAQMLWYSSFYRAAINAMDDAADSGFRSDQLAQLQQMFITLGSGDSQTAFEQVTDKGSIERRVLSALKAIHKSTPTGSMPPSEEALVLLAMTRVPDINYVEETGEYSVGDGRITLLQLLLRKSLQIEKNLRRAEPADNAINLKIRKLEQLTYPQKTHSYSASTALIEIFGSEQLINLLGGDAKYLGQHLTMNQLLKSVQGMHEVNRNRDIRAWRSAPPYAKSHGVGDPPYSSRDYTPDPETVDVPLNAYTIVVDALAASANTQFDALESRDATAHKDMITVLENLRGMVDTWARDHAKRLGSTMNRRAVLEDMFAHRPDVAVMLAPLIQDASRVGAFQVIDGRVYAANWVMEVLTNPDLEKAALWYHVYSGFAELNAVGGEAEWRREREGGAQGAAEPFDVSEDDAEQFDVSEVDPTKIKTEFAMTIYRLASDGQTTELLRMMKAIREAPNLTRLYERINSEPKWRGNRAKLLPYHQDVSLYSSDPKDQFTPNLPGALFREELSEMATRMSVVGAATLEESINRKVDRTTLRNMLQHLEDGTDRDDASQFVGLLRKAIENARLTMDSMGQAARDQFLEVVQDMVARMQDKGTADPRVAPAGEWLVTADTFGVKQGWMLELDALTSLDWTDVKTNLTKLLQGPVRIQTLDGAVLTLDMTDPKTLVQMLLDERTSAFAKAVLFPTVRDINNANVLQHYTDTDNPGSITEMLKEASNVRLFKDVDGHAAKLKQATRYLNYIESGHRQNLIPNLDPDTDDDMLPITVALSEFMVAYTQGPQGTKNSRLQRERLVIEVADTLKMLTTVPKTERPRMLRNLKTKMIALYEGNVSELEGLFEKTLEDEFLEEDFRTSLTQSFLAVDTAATNDILAKRQELSQTTDQRKIDRLNRDIKDLEDRIALAKANHDAVQNRDWGSLSKTYQSVDDIVRGFRLVEPGASGMTDSEREAENNARKKRMRDFMATGLRRERFRAGDTYGLVEKLRFVTHEGAHMLYDERAITDKEWDQIALWCSTASISEDAVLSASDVALVPMVLEKGRHIRRYHDTSFGFLLDYLFDEKLLEVADKLSRDVMYPTSMSTDQIEDKILTTVVNRDRLGQYTDRIPVEMMKARRLLDGASVGLAIPVAGIIPKVTMDQVGTGWVTFSKPDPAKHHTTTTVSGSYGASLYSLVDPLELNKLEHHFASRVVVRHPSLPNGEVDVTSSAVFPSTVTQEVEESGYGVLRMVQVQRAIEALHETYDFDSFEVEIEYVDVDKTPYQKEYVNSIYFDGVGPDAEASSASGGPIAQSVFGVGGWSKLGQQMPLDFAARGGSGFTPTITSALTKVLELEDTTQYPTIAEQMLAKVNRMWSIAYDIGHMRHADRPALHKLLKQRHVVVGRNAAGEKIVMWAADYISREANGDPIPITQGAKLVPLSETVAATLLSDNTVNGKPDIVTRPVLNAQDMDPMPPLDAARLKKLGLDRLGEDIKWNDTRSPLFSQVPLPRAVVTAERGAEIRTAYQERERIWTSEAARVYAAASNKLGYAERAASIRARNRANLEQVLEAESLSWVFARLNIPFPQMRDVASTQISRIVAKNLEELTGGNTAAMFWEYEQGVTGDLALGILSPDLINNDFEMMRDRPPVFQDVVNIKLDSFMKAVGGPKELDAAVEQAKAVIRSMADRGLTIVLTSENGDTGLRSVLTDWMLTGAVKYRQFAGSAHVFTPARDGSMYGSTRDALLSTLTSVQHYTGNDIALMFLSDEFGTEGASENTVFVDLDNDIERSRVVHTLLPVEMVNTRGHHSGQSMIFNTPVTDLDGVDQVKYVRERVLKMLKDPDVRRHLKSLTNSSGDPRKADPGHPVNKFRRTVTPGGEVIIEPGVLDIDAAFDLLQAQFEANDTPLGDGKQLMVGQIVPELAADGKTILFNRVGYKIPDHKEMPKQLATKYNGERSLNVAISMGELNTGHTVPAPFIQVGDPRPTKQGLSIVGTYDLNKWGKWVEETLGFKEGVVRLEHYSFPEDPMSANDLRVTRATAVKPKESKRARRGIVRDFSWLFSVTGIDFREIMVEAFWGQPPNGGYSEAVFNDLWSKTENILRKIADNDYGMTDEAVAEAMRNHRLHEFMSREVNQAASQLPNWNEFKIPEWDPNTEPEPREALATKLLLSLLAPSVRLEHVIATPGLMTLSDLQGNGQVTLMPKLLTDSLYDMDSPRLRDMLFDMANSAMPRDSSGRRLYEFTNDFRFHVQMQPKGKDGKPSGPVEWKSGYLQVILPQPAEENTVSYAQASIQSRMDESAHLAAVLNGGLTARLETGRDPYKKFDRFHDGRKVIRFGQEDPDGSRRTFWDMLTRLDVPEEKLTVWDKLMPAEWKWVTDADRRTGQYMMPITKTDQVLWPDLVRANAVADAFLAKLGLTSHVERDRIEVDRLVRQFLGRPAPAKDQADYQDNISQEMYLQTVSLMSQNLDDGFHPLHGGMVPMEHRNFWRKVFEANPAGNRTWAPTAGARTGRKPVKVDPMTWEQWITTLVGQMRDSNKEFHSMYRLDVDGMWHSYQGSTGLLNQVAISTDEFINLGLMDPETNELYLSLDVGQNAILRDPIILDTMRASLDALAGYDSEYKVSVAHFVPATELSEQFTRQKNWLRSKKVSPQEKMTFRQYMNEGAVYIDSTRTTSSFFRGLVNLSIVTRLLNPALYVSAFIEVPARNAMEHATNLITGSHLGIGGTAIAKAGERVGVKPRYTAAEIEMLNQLARQMGQSNKFLALMYEDITFRNFVERGHNGALSNKLEWMAAASARVTSDPRFGMKMSSAAKRYLEAALEYYAYTDAQFSIPQFVQKMEQNPLWLQEQAAKDVGLSAHDVGMNRIAQVRSIKATAMSKTLMSPVEALTSSSSSALNGLGHALKIPFLFTRFNANAFLALTGLNGVDQVVAMLVDGRKKPGFIRNMGARVRGESVTRSDEFFDMSDVLEGFDLTRPLIRMAATQTGLMAAMMMAQGLGLGGEDEEMRKRRALSKYLNTPLYLDPREAQNDFLYSDALFLDNVSIFGINTIFEDPNGRSAVVPHWILRQFTSPMMGMQRFFETGNWREIQYGFKDAISVLPNSALRLLEEADLTAELLAQAAADEQLDTSAAAQSKVTQLLISIAGVYEKALIENSFVNSIRNGADQYNRNPWFVPQTDETGNIVHAEGRNNMPLRTDALVQFQNEQGQTQGAYRTRQGMDAYAHQYAENNLTFAILASLFTGQFSDSTFARKNMVVAEKEVTLPEADRAQVEALLLSAYENNPQVALTMDETIRLVKQKYQDADIWWDQATVEKEAAALYEANSTKMGATSLLDAEGKELITKEGANGVYAGLASGLIDFSDASLAGLHIPWEMREAIAEEWATQLIQEGVDLGLGVEAATFRMNRLMKGDPTNPDVPGLREIIYDKRISATPDVKYNQLNMMFMIGPDGRPWATPFARQSVMQSLGIPLPTGTEAPGTGMSQDDTRGKLVDDVLGINLGLHGLERKQVEPEEPPDWDIPIQKAEAKTYTPSGGSAYKKTPWKKFSRGSYGGGGSYYGPNFQRMQALPGGTSPRADGIQMINTSNPQIRRSNVHRERITSERGRLKQWQ